jgi:hypothetical protein
VVGGARHDQHGPRRDGGDGGDRLRLVQTQAPALQRPAGGQPAQQAVAAELQAALLGHVGGRAGQGHGAQPGLGRRHLGHHVAAHREPEHAHPLAIDLGPRGQPVDGGDQGPALPLAPVHLALALALPRPVEQQDAEAPLGQHAGLGQHLRSITARAVREDHGGAVLRSQVPAAQPGAPQLDLGDAGQPRGGGGDLQGHAPGEEHRLLGAVGTQPDQHGQGREADSGERGTPLDVASHGHRAG